MSATELQFTKSWTSAADFPTYEGDETKVRADMQFLFDEIKAYVNGVLLPDLLDRVPGARTVNGKPLTANVALTKADVGLGNADNTSDQAKPVSAAQQAALNQKADKSNVLGRDNTAAYTPTLPYHPATKSYADQVLAGAALGQIPDGSIGSAKLTAELNAYLAGLETALTAKVPSTRKVNGKPLSADITLSAANVGASPVGHSHAQSDVTGLASTLASLMPSGGVIMWSGAANAIPAGWALCNGSNGTPDLRGRFIVGAGGAYAVGATGGAEQVTLTEAQMPEHTHTTEDAIDGHFGETLGYGGTNVSTKKFYGANDSRTYAEIVPAGGGQAHENRPPYYALCYIMRL